MSEIIYSNLIGEMKAHLRTYNGEKKMSVMSEVYADGSNLKTHMYENPYW